MSRNEATETDASGASDGSGGSTAVPSSQRPQDGPPRRVKLDWLRAPLLGCIVVFPLVLLVVFLRWWLEWAITPVQLGLGLTVAYAVAWKTAQIRIDRDEGGGDAGEPSS